MTEIQLWGFLLSPNAKVHQLVRVDDSLLLEYPDGFIDEIPCPESLVGEIVGGLMSAIPGLDVRGVFTEGV
jgi:hypothetical protein